MIPSANDMYRSIECTGCGRRWSPDGDGAEDDGHQRVGTRPDLLHGFRADDVGRGEVPDEQGRGEECREVIAYVAEGCPAHGHLGHAQFRPHRHRGRVQEGSGNIRRDTGNDGNPETEPEYHRQ
jgi:hypothetical protein